MDDTVFHDMQGSPPLPNSNQQKQHL